MKGALRGRSTRVVRKGWLGSLKAIFSNLEKKNKYVKYPLFVVVVESLSHVQLFCNPMDCSTPGSSVHGISQARILEWGIIPFSRDLPNPGIEPTSPALGGFFTTEPPGRNSHISKRPHQLSEHSFQPWSKTGLCRAKITVLCFILFFYRRSLFTLLSNLAGDQKLPGVDLKRTPPSHCSSTPDVLTSLFYSPLH